MVVKEEFGDFREEMREMIDQKFSDFREEMRETYATKEDFNSLNIKLDKILKEIIASRQEETLLSHRVSDHEDRISALESTHS